MIAAVLPFTCLAEAVLAACLCSICASSSRRARVGIRSTRRKDCFAACQSRSADGNSPILLAMRNVRPPHTKRRHDANDRGYRPLFLAHDHLMTNAVTNISPPRFANISGEVRFVFVHATDSTRMKNVRRPPLRQAHLENQDRQSPKVGGLVKSNNFETALYKTGRNTPATSPGHPGPGTVYRALPCPSA